MNGSLAMAGSNLRRHKPATSNKISAYFLHHLQSLVFSLGKIYQAPATTIMTVAVIGITLSLPGGFYLSTPCRATFARARKSASISTWMSVKSGPER
jgi:cell division transport system permease protein